MKISISYEPKEEGFSGKQGLYACVAPVYGLRHLRALIASVFDDANIKMEPDDDLHCTLMYSREKAPEPAKANKLLLQSANYAALPYELEYWDGHDSAGYIVLKMKSDTLADRHEAWKSAGCEHSFPDYVPHITVAKDLQKESNVTEAIAKINGLLANYDRPIIFGDEKISDIHKS
jgi:2'-5' RNA ligase